jgi:hypothetical protein
MLIISIALEAAVAIWLSWRRAGKPYIYGLAFTFGAYVLYDLARSCTGTCRLGFFHGCFCWRRSAP